MSMHNSHKIKLNLQLSFAELQFSGRDGANGSKSMQLGNFHGTSQQSAVMQRRRLPGDIHVPLITPSPFFSHSPSYHFFPLPLLHSFPSPISLSLLSIAYPCPSRSPVSLVNGSPKVSLGKFFSAIDAHS
jgi:hypothetical protein